MSAPQLTSLSQANMQIDTYRAAVTSAEMSTILSSACQQAPQWCDQRVISYIESMENYIPSQMVHSLSSAVSFADKIDIVREAFGKALVDHFNKYKTSLLPLSNFIKKLEKNHSLCQKWEKAYELGEVKKECIYEDICITVEQNKIKPSVFAVTNMMLRFVTWAKFYITPICLSPITDLTDQHRCVTKTINKFKLLRDEIGYIERVALACYQGSFDAEAAKQSKMRSAKKKPLNIENLKNALSLIVNGTESYQQFIASQSKDQNAMVWIENDN